MTKLLRALLIASPLFLLQTALAQVQYNYQQIGNTGLGTLSGPKGYQGTYTRQQIGNFTHSSYSDRNGSTHCTTSRLGNQAIVNCY